MAVTEIRRRASGRTTNPETVLDTALNSLASAGSATSAAFSNDGTTELSMLVDVEIVLASLTPGTNPRIEIWMLASIDSTNYPDTGILVGSIEITTGASAKREVIYDLPVPLKDFKVKLVNQAGVALAATGNTVKLNPYNVQLNG